MTAKYPHVIVPLVGEDGNAFAIMGRVSKALKRAGEHEAAEEYTNAAFEAESYDALLRLTLEYVSEDEEMDDEDDEGECWTCGIKTTYDDTVCEDCDEDDAP